MEPYDLLGYRTKGVLWADLTLDYELLIQTFLAENDMTYDGFYRVFEKLKVADIYVIANGRGDDPDLHYKETVKLILNTAKDFWLNRYKMVKEETPVAGSGCSKDFRLKILSKTFVETESREVTLKDQQRIILTKQIAGFWLTFTLWYIAPKRDKDCRVGLTKENLELIEKWKDNIKQIFPNSYDGIAAQLGGIYRMEAFDFVFFEDSYDHEKMQSYYLQCKNAGHVEPTLDLWDKNSNTLTTISRVETLIKKNLDSLAQNKELQLATTTTRKKTSKKQIKGITPRPDLADFELMEIEEAPADPDALNYSNAVVPWNGTPRPPAPNNPNALVPWDGTPMDRETAVLKVGLYLSESVRNVLQSSNPSNEFGSAWIIGNDVLEDELDGYAKKVKENVEKHPGPPSKKYQTNIFGTATVEYTPAKRAAKTRLVQNVWDFIGFVCDEKIGVENQAKSSDEPKPPMSIGGSTSKSAQVEAMESNDETDDEDESESDESDDHE